MSSKTSHNANILLDRLKVAYNFKSDSQLSKFLGVKPNTISTWRERNSINFKLILAKCDDLNLNWLFTGEGPMFREEERNLQERIQELEAELKKMEEAEEEGEDTRVPGEGLLARLQDALKHLNKAPNSG